MTETNREEQRKSFLEYIEGDYDYTTPKRGDVFQAVIMEIDDNDIVVDLGTKRDGIIPSVDLRRIDDEYLKTLSVGDRIPVVVMRPYSDADGVLVSLNKGLQEKDWITAQEMLESGEDITCKVVDYNRGGVLVEFGRIRGFVPNSHLTSLPSGLRAGSISETKEELVGEELTLVVLDVDPRRRRLVLSKRAADRRRRKDLIHELTPGEKATGVVRNIVDFGAFVDLGGIDGLIHISELDWQHVNHPNDVLDIGDEVEVVVLNVDIERERIGLSRKRALPDPWDTVISDINEGDVIEGTITNTVDFGIFVDVGQGVEGLLHNSEIPFDARDQMELDRGATIDVRVLSIDTERRRISLQLVEPEGGLEPEAQDEASDDVEPTEFLYG